MSSNCSDKHKPLEKKIDSIHKFLFGDLDNSNEISFASKVNLMFEDVSDIKKWFLRSIVTIILAVGSACVFFGKQLITIEASADRINSYLEIETRNARELATLKEKVGSIERKIVIK